MLSHRLPGESTMIDAVDLDLTSSADGIVGKGLSSLLAPDSRPSPHGVSLYFPGLISLPPPRAAKKVRLQISLGYLVTSWSDDPTEAHKLVGELLFAALENSEFTVEAGAIPMDARRCLGTTMPCFPSGSAAVQRPASAPQPNAFANSFCRRYRVSVSQDWYGSW